MRSLLLLSWWVLALSARVAFAAGDVTALIQKGDTYDAQLNTAAALQTYLEAEKAGGGNDSSLLVRIARQYAFSMNDTRDEDEQLKLGQKALEYSQRAVQADPKNAKAQLSVAICYGRLATLAANKKKIEYSRLIKEYAEAALALDPADAYAYHVLGAWNYELANINAVMRTVAKMIYGEIPQASLESAEKYFRKAVDIAPQRVSHRVELGRTYLALGKKDLAEAELRRALALPNREKDDPESKRRATDALRKL